MKKFYCTYSNVFFKTLFPKFFFLICSVVLAGNIAFSQQCSPISSLTCPAIVKSLPVGFGFTGSEGGLQDKNGLTVGFTMVDNPSNPIVVPSNPTIPGFEPVNLEISGGALSIATTSGIAYLNPSKSSNTNSQVNGLGVGFKTPSKFSIQVNVLQPNAGTGKSEQAGLWFGLNEDNFVKFVVLSAGGGTSKMEFRKEVAAISGNSDSKLSAAMVLSNSVVTERLEVDKTAGTIEAFYSIDGSAEVSMGVMSIPQSFTNGITLSDGVTSNVSFAGIFATHRSASQSLTFKFDDFKVEEIVGPAPLPSKCSPLSPFNCPTIVKTLPVTLGFTGSEGGVADKNGMSTGFMMVDHPSNPTTPPTYPAIPGYEPGNLQVSGGKLTITTTSGISYLDPAHSSNTNSQVNALGEGFVAPSAFSVQTTLIQPDAGSGKSEQAGVWFGLNEDNFVKLVVISSGSGTSKIELRKELGAVSGGSDSKSSGAMVLSSSNVTLRMEVNSALGTVDGYYTINGGLERSVGAIGLPASLTSGITLPDGVTKNITFAGVFATHRSASASVVFNFDDFKIEQVNAPGPVIALCSPISPLECPAIVKGLPFQLDFTGSEGGLQEETGLTTGFTMVDFPSNPLVTPTYFDLPGYEPLNLQVANNRLNIKTTSGISYLNPAQSANTNSQVNALGAGFVAPVKFNVITTLLQPSAGTGRSEQAGLWFGLDEDNFVKFVVVSAGNGMSKFELRKEVGAMSTNADAKTSAGMVISSSVVKLRLEVDKISNTVEGFYTLDGAAEVNVGSLSIPATFTEGKTLNDDVTKNVSFAGIFATHRSASKSVTFSFDDFKIEEIAVPKSLLFTESTKDIDVQQGSSFSQLEYLSTADNSVTSATLNAVDASGNVPSWLSVNGSFLDGINFTTGSEISFDIDATNLSIGSYSAVVTASSIGYNSAVLNIMLTVSLGSSGTLTNLKVNFQNASTVPLSGWVRDYGQPFGPRTSNYQGSGATYGWKSRADGTPVDFTQNGRLRDYPSDILAATFMHMQGNNINNFNGNPTEGIWEAKVADGNYDVTISVGDASEFNSKHFINIEGVNAIVNFIPTTSIKFKTATISVAVTDGFLTIDAIGGTNTKINWVTITPTSNTRPSVVLLNPENGAQNVSENASVSSSILNLPNSGLNNLTINSTNVYLVEDATGEIVPSNVNGSGGGDVITLVPASPLKLSTTYKFYITDGVKDLSGASFIPYSSIFRTGSVSTSQVLNARFDKVDLPNTVGRHSNLTIGPDGKLYALTIDGLIKRFVINSDGTLGVPEILYSLQDEYGTRQQRLAVGFAFDPSATADNLIVWITHDSFVFLNAPDWDGKLTRLSGSNLENVQDVVVNLPRSVKDHVTNSIAFGPDGALYFTQGSTSAMGKADNTWGLRNEHVLNAAVLRLDLNKLGSLPLNVKTADGGGPYNPYLSSSPLTIYASGVRNAYDLVWHSNGQLYVPTNGSAAGGNTPESVQGTLRTDLSHYSGPDIPSIVNSKQTQKDYLFRIEKGGYYGHPNPQRGEYVMNGGNPTANLDPAQVDEYPVGTLPDVNWRGYSFDFQANKSPNGVIEYKSDAFDGALKGKLMIVRYSQNDDIITLGIDPVTKDIVSSNEGTAIQGFTGFLDPLDLVEDTTKGNIYVSEYGGDGRITLLKPKTANGIISISPDKIYDNDVAGGLEGPARQITIKNVGLGSLILTKITKTGIDTSQFNLTGLPVLPVTLAPGASTSVNVAFNPSGTGVKSIFLNIESDDTLRRTVAVPIRGLGTKGLGGSNEPSLQSIVDLYNLSITVGDDDPSTNVINSSTTLQKAALLGEEINSQRFVKAGGGDVTIEPLAVFGPTTGDPVLGLGWYVSGNATAQTELFTVSNNPVSNGQTVNVKFNGALSFDPLTDTFGFYSRWPFFGDRHLFSEDALNTFGGSIPHHVRVYPYKNQTGTVPNTYLVAFEENTSGFDYQDVIFIVRNVKPADLNPAANSMLFVENMDKFPSNDHYVTSRIQIPWSRDQVNYNLNHDTAKIRINNKGIDPLVVSNFVLSNKTTWKVLSLNGNAYDSASTFPLTIPSGGFADLWLQFIAVDLGTRAAVSHESLTIVSNDDKFHTKTLYLHGLWQFKGESNNEPYAQEIIDAFGFKTSTGFVHTDPDFGDSTLPKGDEIIPSYFVRADSTRPVTIRQMAAYHGCCTTGESIQWYMKDSAKATSIFHHIGLDAQSVLPRKGPQNIGAEGTINPKTPFGFKIAPNDYTDARKNPGGKIAFRVWKAIGPDGAIIPNSYILSNDYSGTTATNYDYNDNMYFISNIRPENGPSYTSSLGSAPSALDFGENVLRTVVPLQLDISNLGMFYPNGSSDPAITISSIVIGGENSSEFSVLSPSTMSLNPGEHSSLTVNFAPLTQGLKIADLLIYYDNARSVLRVPLYGIAKASGTIVNTLYRINSGASSPVTVNGKVWSADNQYSFDNLEPYTNPALKSVKGTDDDVLFFREQSSNGDKKPFRYELPVANGDYVVRLHFAEIVWGAPGNGFAGGAGSRVMSVSVEGQLRLINLDVAGEVGPATALVKNIPVTVTDGKLNINFSATVNRPMINALEIYSFQTTAPLLSKLTSISQSNTIRRPRVYPNPLRDNFTVEFPAEYSGYYTLQIVDLLGRTHKTSTVILQPGHSNTSINVSVPSLRTGVYFLRIYNSDKKPYVVKLLIE